VRSVLTDHEPPAYVVASGRLVATTTTVSELFLP
jgi:hypothetical protein